MSVIYEFPTVIESYGLTLEQWFDPFWNYVDPYQLSYYYRGQRAYLICGNNHVPTFFEVHGKTSKEFIRLSFAKHWKELTTSEDNLSVWLATHGTESTRRAPICTYGQSMLETFICETKRIGGKRLLWHIENRKKELRKDTAVVDNNEPPSSFLETAAAVILSVTKLLRQ